MRYVRPLLLALLVLPPVLASTASPAVAQKVCPDNICPPNISISPSGGAVGSPLSVTITWSSGTYNLSGSTRSIYLNGTNVTSSFTYSGNLASAQSQGSLSLSAGSNTLSTSICDVQGNCGQKYAFYTYDATAPGVSISPAGGYWSSASLSVTISWSDNVALNSGSRSVTLNGTNVTSSFNYTGGGTSAQSAGTVTLAPGPNDLRGTICDQAGNCTAQRVTYRYDNANPTVGFSPASSTFSSSSPWITINWGDNMALNPGSVVITRNGVTVTNAFTWGGGGASGTSSGTLALAPGNNRVDATICDQSGRCSTASADYVYDNANPTVGFSPASSTFTSSSPWITINWGDNIALNSGSVAIKRNGLNVTNAFTWGGGGTSGTSSGTLALAHGNNRVDATICDQSGRCSTASADYVYDNANPGVSISPGTSSIPAGTSTVSASIGWSDDLALNLSTRLIKLNGSNITTSFTHSGSGTSSTSTATALTIPPGTNTLYGYVCDNAGRCSSSSVTYTRPATYTVAVTPDGGSTSLAAGQSGTYAFTVVNQGNSQATYTLTPSCAGTGATSTCSVSPTSLALAGGSGGTATLSFGTNYGAGSLDLGLSASGSGASDVGSATVTLTYTGGDPVVPVITWVAPLGEERDRSSCLTMALAPAAEASCGELRLAHGLPAMRTLGKTFAPALVYNATSATDALLSLPTDVKLPTGGRAPDSVITEISLNGSVAARRALPGFLWVPGTARRVVPYNVLNTTGVVTYALVVSNKYGSVLHSDTVSGTALHVSRAASPFGSGWWVAGLEELHTSGSDLVWVGGDGSARLYHATGTGKWVANNRTRPDSILQEGTEYVRVVPGGVRVRFNASGQHIKTHDRNGNITTFSYASGRLDRITLPVASGTAPYYQFNYGTNAKLMSVQAVGAGATLTTQASIPADKLESLTDADGTQVTFEYPSSGSRVISGRSVTNGSLTRFEHSAARHVTRVDRYLDATAYVSTTIRPQQSQGLYGDGTMVAADPGTLHTWIDGPRTQIDDTTRFYLNAYSQPDSVRDPLGEWSRLRRADSRWPALVTRTVKPGGQIVAAAYDTRGRITESADSSSYAQVAKTTYLWDDACDLVERVTRPEGDYTTYTYTAACNLETVQDNRGSSSEVVYAFDNRGRIESIDPPAALPTTFYYDPVLGNLTRIQDPLGHSTHLHGNAWGQDTLVVTPVSSTTSQRVRTYYDAMGRDTLTVTIGDPTGYSWNSPSIRNVTLDADTMKVWQAYDSEGNLLTVDRTVFERDGCHLGVCQDSAEEGYTSRRRNISTFRYDRLNRRVYSSEAGASDSTVYDPAGNTSLWINRMGHHVTMEYDAANRLTGRVSEAIDYPRTCLTDSSTLCQFYYWPRYPNDGDDLRIPADTAIFDYDADGNMTVAANGAARIGRTYHPNGLLKEDTLRVRVYAPDAVFSHVYVTKYQYDLNGRPTVMTYPSQLNVGAVSYSYHPWGPLKAVAGTNSPSTHNFTFSYDGQNRLTATHYPGGGRDTVTYDALGRLETRLNTTPTRGTIHNDAFTRDLLGRTTHVNTAGGEVSNWYSPAGPLVAVNWYDGNSWERRTEEFVVDPAGLLLEGRREEWGGAPQLTTHIRSTSTRVLEMRVQEEGATMADETSTDFTFHASGAVDLKHTLTVDANGASRYRQTDKSWYDGLDRLAAYQRNDQTYDDPFVSKGVFEEYRYDALGRRVLLRSRKDDLSNEPDKISYIERFVWAGDQLIGEFRAQGGNYATTAEMESDNASGRDYGRVGYVHAGGIDRPLSMFRTGHPDMTGYVVPHTNWRGIYDTGTDGAGDWAECPNGSTSDCPYIKWPGDFLGVYGDRRNAERWDWMGSLARDMADASGLAYRRNRYYDPATGEFTQVDPIGIAGGLNLYGYANGDPVSYSDPFGLCPPEDDEPCSNYQRLANWGAARGGLIGNIAVNAGAALEAFVAVGEVVVPARCDDGVCQSMGPVIGPGGRLPTTAMGKAVTSLRTQLQGGGGAWLRGSAHAEAAAGRAYRGATSIEEVFVHGGTGEQMVRHTIYRGSDLLHETFRRVAKFGTP